MFVFLDFSWVVEDFSRHILRIYFGYESYGSVVLWSRNMLFEEVSLRVRILLTQVVANTRKFDEAFYSMLL